MKKLYRKSTVHPSPTPPSQQATSADPLAFLPAAILTLVAALTPEDREVLAYLLSCSSGSPSSPATTGVSKHGVSTKDVKSGGSHPAAFNCDCFSCYTGYWARWDSSPNRQLIHEIIDAYEDWIVDRNRGSGGKNRGGRRERKKKAKEGGDSPGVNRVSDVGLAQGGDSPEKVEHDGDCGGDAGGSGVGGEEEEEGEKGSVKKLVSFIGEKVWSFWG